MDFQILGPGCINCKKLAENTSNFGSSAAQGMARAAVGNRSGGPWAAPPRKRKPPPATLLRICELSKNSPAR